MVGEGHEEEGGNNRDRMRNRPYWINKSEA